MRFLSKPSLGSLPVAGYPKPIGFKTLVRDNKEKNEDLTHWCPAREEEHIKGRKKTENNHPGNPHEEVVFKIYCNGLQWQITEAPSLSFKPDFFTVHHYKDRIYTHTWSI